MDAISSLFVSIFGDSPTTIVINGALLAVIAYWCWRLVISPLIAIAHNVRAYFADTHLQALELIPPKRSEIDPQSTSDLFAVMSQRLGKYDTISFEIVGNKYAGIRYRVVAPAYTIASIQKYFAAYLPELRFKHHETLDDTDEFDVYCIAQSRHFAFPLIPHDELQKSDPISFLHGAMTRLSDDEEVAMQLVVRRYTSRKASRIYNRLIGKGQVLLDNKPRYYLIAYSWLWVPSLLIGLLAHAWQFGAATAIVLWVASLSAEKQERQITHLEQNLYATIAAKLEKPLLQTDIRFGVRSMTRTGGLVNEFVSSLEPLNTTNFQYLILKRQRFGTRQTDYLRRLFTRRVGSILPFNSSVLNTSELAMLFHFPHGLIKTEGVTRSHSRTLPAPLSLHSDTDFDIVIGANKHHGSETPIGLTSSERERHMFIVGGTGSGKTTMLKYQLVQDIRGGKGVAIIDPHGDLAEELLEHMPKEREKDLIYLNPDDLDHPIGVNLLELPEGLEGNNLLREKDRVTESVVSVMRKVFSEDDSGGHRIEYVLRNTVQTALTLERPTLFTIFRLLNDGKFAKDAIKNLQDEDLKAFWRNELGKAGSMQKVKMAAGITAKIGRFLFSASARAMLEQEKSAIDFDEILDGKILICNFSKGRLGEDTSMLFGITILAKLQLAALKRAEKKRTDRKPFYLYVDEFQNFATMSFTQMLSEARKYQVFLTMAEQSTQQQDDQKLVNIILANVGTVVAFRTGSPKDEELILPLFEPYIEKGEIANLPTYNFYCRIMGVEAQEPISGETIV
ncbi:type IV secretion system DNA-binding domain-containing protein [Candidatus Saccharibacteria bacterium]|nr:type IV secretion system DNA-binding domain-containing protein [Candidatus Saccharibacteria bacterium]